MAEVPPPPPGSREAIGHVAVRPYGKYFLVKKLAEGGMAEIFLAKQVGVEGFEKNVVIKRMLAHLSGVPDFVAMFLDEARLAASLSHANIVQISDLGLADGCYYICMEFLAGEDFSTVLRTAKRRNEHVPMHVTLRVLAEAASGLHFAHEFADSKGRQMNIVHRDISPSNIFVTYSGQVKVLDFGIAKAESRITNTTAGVVKGKYQYMSPEQAQSGNVDRRSDIYSLGVSLYEALTLTRPFARDTDLAILNAVLNSDYPPLRSIRPDLPQEIEAIVNKAMAFKVEDRYDTAADMASDIERYIGAMTSASGGTALSSYMKGFFGEERVRSKLRIESLEELAARGVDVPGRANPMSPKTDPGNQPAVTDPHTKAVGLPISIVEQRNKESRTKVLGLIGALVVVGTCGTGLAIKTFQDRKQIDPPLPKPDPIAAIDSGASTQVAVVPRVDPVLVVDAGAPSTPEVVDAGPPDKPNVVKPNVVQPVVLSGAMVSRLMGANNGKLRACLTSNKKQLPSEKGRIVLNITIPSSGKVSEVDSEFKGTPLGTCLENVVKAIRFPVHVDAAVRVPVPLNYDNGTD